LEGEGTCENSTLPLIDFDCVVLCVADIRLQRNSTVIAVFSHFTIPDICSHDCTFMEFINTHRRANELEQMQHN
jgi:hypothetical protein